MRLGVQRAILIAELGEQLGPEQLPDLGGAAHAEHLDLGLQVVHHQPGGHHAHVGGDEHLFDLVPGLIVEPVPGQQVQQR